MKNAQLVVTGVLITSLLFRDASCVSDDFVCPEEFGYYQHPGDCSKYYVCVFGGPHLESCTEGLMYSHELQTCDWPRNVICVSGKREIFDADDFSGQVWPDIPRITPEAPKKNVVNIIPVTSTTSRSAAIASINDVEIHNDAAYFTEDDNPFFTHSASSTESVNHPRRNIDAGAYEDDINEFIDVSDGPIPDLGGQHQKEEVEDLATAENGVSNFVPHLVTDQDDYVDIDFDYKDLYEEEDRNYYIPWDDIFYTEKEYSDSSNRNRRLTGNNVTVDYQNPPQRPPVVRPELQFVNPGAQATACKNLRCHLPDCLCGQTRLKEMAATLHRPQLVILTFDDSVNDLNRDLYQEIFKEYRRNPNGCHISGTFFVSHEWTDYSQVQNLYANGHEIASHSISHSYGEQFSQSKWMVEMVGQRELLSAFAGIPLEDIRGMRAPFLAIGGDNMFEMMYEANFTYDSSMPIYENKPPAFPYTLDYRMAHDCMIPPCPERSYPGLWEIPLVMWNDLGNGRCSKLDACSNPNNPEDVYKLLWQNFARHYNTNRAPINLSTKGVWFDKPENMEGFERFLDTILSLDDVWFVTSWQAIQWMRNLANPVDPLMFEPFQCKHRKRKAKLCTKPKVCNLWHNSGVRYMRTCQECPPDYHYPWTGNTGISNSLANTF